MRINLSVKIVFLLFFLTSGICAQSSRQRSAIDSLLNNPLLESAQISIDVFNLTTGSSVYSRNEKLLFRPASNQKLITTTAALHFLGTDFKFNTSVYADGIISENTLLGNIYLKGGFDPEFTSSDIDSLINLIKSKGIYKIDGNLYADVSMMDSLFWGSGWMWDDDPSPFSAYLSPLTVDDNSILVITEASEIGKSPSIKIIPDIKFNKIQNGAATVSGSLNNLIIDRDWINRSNKIVIKGTIGVEAQPDTTKLNLFNPANYFIQLFRERLETSGIIVTGKIDTLKTPETSTELASIQRDIEPVISNINKFSDNLSAELILRAIPYYIENRKASFQSAKKYLDSIITFCGLNPNDYKIADGSGLSFYNLVTTSLINRILQKNYYSNPTVFSMFFNSLPIAGTDGTLKARMNNEESATRVRAKTGTISGVSSLSGYIRAQNSDLLSFSILVQNYVVSHSKIRNFIDSICALLIKANN